MKTRWLIASLATVAVGSALVMAEPAEMKKKLGKLTKPWSDMSSLTEEQKLQIREIHAVAVAEIKAIQAKEKSDILALLSEDQKTELASIEAARKKPAEKKPENTAEKTE